MKRSHYDATPLNFAVGDEREQLYNGGERGQIEQIQHSTERIVQLRGILFDVDPKLIVPGTMIPHVPQEPHMFYDTVLRPMLDRHDVLRRAEVRNSGTGVHVILRFAEPVIFQDDAARDRWAGIVQVVQCALPIDPDQPGMTAATRPIGSINNKNDATVKLLHGGDGVSEADVIGLYEEMIKSPFKTVMKIVTGQEKIEPCPICKEAGTKLSALDRAGRCYGSCGTVNLGQLYDQMLSPRN